MAHSSDPAELRDYLKNSVNPVIEPLVIEILKQRPKNVTEFIISHLQKKTQASKQPQAGNRPQINIRKTSAQESASSDDNDEDVEDDAVFDQNKLKMLKDKPRASVSAEVYGQFNKKEDFEARVLPKSAEQKQRIMDRLSKAFMFASLDPKEKEIVVNAMEEKHIKAGEWIIKQGEDGNELYVLHEGKLECFKQFKKGEDAKMVKVYNPGESFGELALLYNAPRAASIRAMTDAVMFALDRPTFNNIVKDAEVKRRQKFETTLTKIEVLEAMDPYERSKIADVATSVRFKTGEYIIKQGEAGDKFYFIDEGTAEATKILKGKDQVETVYKYKAGDYFGELALLKDEPRAANVIATSDMTLLSLDRDAFTRVLGPLTDILKRNTQKYEKFM